MSHFYHDSSWYAKYFQQGEETFYYCIIFVRFVDKTSHFAVFEKIANPIELFCANLVNRVKKLNCVIDYSRIDTECSMSKKKDIS